MISTKALVPFAVLLASLSAGAWSQRRSPRADRVVTSTPDSAVYEVRLGFRGYTGLAASPDCDVRVDAAGYDSLAGTVMGIEDASGPGEDVVYAGTLKRTTRIDYCQTRGRRSASDDEQVWCVATLTGAARMRVEITVYGDSGEGAWVKAAAVPGPPDTVAVSGTCTPAGMDSIRREYPGGESGGSPDGQPLGETSPPKFMVGGLARLRTGYFPPDPVQGGWGLRVIRRMRP